MTTNRLSNFLFMPCKFFLGSTEIDKVFHNGANTDHKNFFWTFSVHVDKLEKVTICCYSKSSFCVKNHFLLTKICPQMVIFQSLSTFIDKVQNIFQRNFCDQFSKVEKNKPIFHMKPNREGYIFCDLCF